MERGLFHAAVAEYRRALAIKPGYPLAEQNLALAMKQLETHR